MTRLCYGLALLAGLVGSGALQAQERELADGEAIALAIDPIDPGLAILNQSFFFETPGDADRFTLSLTSDGADNNVDVFLVADAGFRNVASVDDLFGQADYVAAASEVLDETLTVERYQNVPPGGRRWFIALLAREGSGGQVILRLDVERNVEPLPATVEVDFTNAAGDPDCDISPWNDATRVSPVGGNSGTTLGEQRRNAMLEAARIVAGRFRTPVPVRVAACWEASGGSANEAVLAVGRPAGAVINFVGARAADVAYSKPVTERLAGTDACAFVGNTSCQDPDVEIRFNVDVDGDEVLGSSRWYYGLTPASASTNVDFVSTATHELMHGFGFTTLLGDDGSLPTLQDGTPASDAYLQHLADDRQGQAVPLTDLASDGERFAVMESVDKLVWTSPEASTSALNDLATVGSGYVRMYAPAAYEDGSSVTHVDLVYCELMLPRNRAGCEDGFRDLGLTLPMMNAVGWSSGPNVAPYLGLMFDRARNGHGFEFQLGGFDAEGRAIYVLTFYSYETVASDPEWFQAVGFVEDGVFYGDRDINAGDGLQQYDYLQGRAPQPQQAIDGHRGEIVLSFNDPAQSDACNDGVDRSDAPLLVAMQWTINDEIDAWCVEPLAPVSSRPVQDFGGLWFAGVDDQGWGFSIENIGDTLFVLVYVYAGDGSPVWFFGLEEGFQPGQPFTLDLIQRTGFSRLSRNGSLSDAVAGTLTLTLVTPSDDPAAGNRVTIDVDYQGLEGGNWSRNDVPIQRLSQPR